MHRLPENKDVEQEGTGLYLWGQTIGLLKHELDWRRSRHLLVTIMSESGSY